ncbi:MAG: PAS domain S-box protein [Promethearchaeota archaeon]|nr:MAG: PAS domain S-box protein [Candidatus Lokiarchaeota archaeon]
MSDSIKIKSDYIELIIFSLVLFFTYLTSFYNYLLFHTIAELFSIIIAGGIFVIAWNSRKNIDNSFFLVMGISFLFIGFIDLIHTLAYTGLNIFIGYDSNLPTSLWIAARYLQAFSFLYAALVVNKKIKVPYLLIGYTVITTILLYFIFMGIFPDCYIEGSGLTPFKIVSEYIIDFILAITIIILYKFRKFFDRTVFIFIISSILTTIISEVAFTFYVSVYGFSNLIGHIFKIIAFFCLYKAVIVIGLENPYNLLFRKLKKSEERYFNLFDSSPVGIGIADIQGNVRAINKEMYKITGYTLKEFKTMNLASTYEDPSLRKKFLNQLQTTGKVHNFEAKFKNKSGNFYYALLNAELINIGDEKVIITNVQDITDKKQFELALSESEEKFRTIAEESSLGIVILQDGLVKYCNKALTDITGYSEDEILKWSQMEFAKKIHPDDLPNVIENYQRNVDGEITSSSYYACRIITKADEIKWIEIRSKGINYLEKPADFATFIDISERKKAERRLEQLISTVSHELRTPITVLLMSLDYLKNHRDTISQDVEDRLMEGISRNIHLLNELAENILILSKIDEKRMELDWVEYSPLEVINEILTLMKPIGQKKNINFELDIDENIQLRGDPKRIDQIFRILIDNSIKYSNNDSTIEIRAINNYKGKFNPNNDSGVLFQFEDHGIGIHKNDLPHLFDRFYRAENVKDISGTGLGLSIAKDLANLHYGDIYVESDFGKGSIFYVFLPKIKL